MSVRTGVRLIAAWGLALCAGGASAAETEAAPPRRRTEIVLTTGWRTGGGPQADFEKAMRQQSFTNALLLCFKECPPGTPSLVYPNSDGGGLDRALAVGIPLKSRLGARFEAATFNFGQTTGYRDFSFLNVTSSGSSFAATATWSSEFVRLGAGPILYNVTFDAESAGRQTKRTLGLLLEAGIFSSPRSRVFFDMKAQYSLLSKTEAGPFVKPGAGHVPDSELSKVGVKLGHIRFGFGLGFRL
jgi:hypothetical protein